MRTCPSLVSIIPFRVAEGTDGSPVGVLAMNRIVLTTGFSTTVNVRSTPPAGSGVASTPMSPLK